jgi:histidyl-tRNA synthetase
MSEPLGTEPYKGVRDFYPEEWARLQSVFANVRNTLRLYGYEEYNASPLERAELYESKTSEEIVNEQTYTFTDRGDRRVTLRPEMTPTLARMVAAKRRELIFPLRWFSIPNVFRYERPQRGRLREHYQVNVDLIGTTEGAEREMIRLVSGVMKSFNAEDADYVIRINSRTLMNSAAKAVGLTEEETKDYLGLLDRKNKMPAEKFEEAREAFSKGEMDPLALILARTNKDVDAEYESLLSLIATCKSEGIENVIFDPTVVRGFLYYTGLVFEVFDTDPENPRALMGGGRYDGLVSLFGGESVPAIGFAFGDVTLIDFLTTHNYLPRASSAPHLFLGTPSKEDLPRAEALAHLLRRARISVLVYTGTKGLGDQIKEASKRGIQYFAAVGESEDTSQSVKLKHLESGEERVITYSALGAEVRS